MTSGVNSKAVLLVVVLWAMSCCGRQHANRRTDIYFAAFFPMTPRGTPEGKIGRGVMPAVTLAIRHINQSPKILRGYKLHMVWNDTKCNPGVGLKAFFDMVHESPKKLVLFGAACSPVTDQIAKAAKHWNLVQLTYADTHPMFTEKSFPHFFRVVPSENEFNPPRLSILRYHNWTRVGTLYQNSAKFALAHNNLVSELEKNNFTVVGSQSFNDEITDQLNILIQKDIRIILGNFNETWARIVFCDAYHRGVYGNKFQWLIVGMYENEWWLKQEPNSSCTPQQIQTALVGVMVMDILPLASREEITDSRRTPLEYEREYMNISRHYSRYHGYAYDGVWAAALAIEEVGRRAHAYNLSLADFSYRNKVWEKLFIDALDKTSFEGVTGPVRFKGNSRRGNVVIKQLVRANDNPENINERCIGEYSGVTRTLYLERCGEVYWEDDRPPKDRTIIHIVPNRVDTTIYSGLCIIASLGIILATCFLIINIKFRNQKHIKMSSPNLNNLIIIGCILTYTSVILLGLDSYMTSTEAFPYICTARAWILMSGFTLSFGSMFSKTWRVHSIFTNVQLNKKVMKDSQLYLIVGLLISIDIVTMTTWQILAPFYRYTKKLDPYYPDDDDGVQIIPKQEYCRSNHMTIFVGCIYAYKGLLMLFGAFLAWETRSVQIPALNDSKYVGMSVYNVAIMCVLGVAVSFVLKDQQNASFIIISIFIIFCTTGTLCLVFVPKIIDLRRDPHGTLDKRGKPTIKTFGSAPKAKTPLQTMEDKLRIANKVNKKYKELMNELDADLKEAIEEVGSDEAQALITNRLKVANDKTHVSFAMDVTDMSSSCSDKTSSQAEQANNSNKHAVTVNATTTNNTSSVGGLNKTTLTVIAQEGSSAAWPSTTSTTELDYYSNNGCHNGSDANGMGPLENVFPPTNLQAGQSVLLNTAPQQSSSKSNGIPFSQAPDNRHLPPTYSDTVQSSAPPPPPPQYDTGNCSSLSEAETQLCRKLSCGHTCDSQESLNSGYSDEEDEDEEEDEMEPGYYHIMPRKHTNECSYANESQSCQTFEDHATQTEDEDDGEEDDLKEDDPAFLAFDYSLRRRSEEDFSPTAEGGWDAKLGKAHSLRFRHKKHHVNPYQPPVTDVNPQSISNQNLNNVDSVEILPIFHKLLEDKRSSDYAFEPPPEQTHPDSGNPHNRFHSARSCPDMSVRCDIVEYL